VWVLPCEGTGIREETIRFAAPSVATEIVHGTLTHDTRARIELIEGFSPLIEEWLIKIDGIRLDKKRAYVVQNYLFFLVDATESVAACQVCGDGYIPAGQGFMHEHDHPLRIR
jgi:hypothetical protein